MELSDDDRITYRAPRRASTATALLIAAISFGIGYAIYAFLQNSAEQPTLANVRQAIGEVVTPSSSLTDLSTSHSTPPAPPTLAVTAPEVAASEPALETPPEAEPLPPLDSSDEGVRQTLAALSGWQAQALTLLVKDQFLRHFVTMVNNIAAGKIDHKTGLFLPIKGKFAVSDKQPLTATAVSQARYTPYVDLITALDPQACADLYRRYYPLLNSAYSELGEKGNFHTLVLKAIQQLEATPELSQAPVLVPATKGVGLYQYAQPQLEALPAVQKQLLRSGWENVSRLKVWLRQLKAALLQAPTSQAPT